MKKFLAAAIMILGFGVSQAHAANEAWACSLTFQGRATGVRLILGFFNFNGTGDLRCTDGAGRHAYYPVRVTMRAAPISPGISLGSYELYGNAGSISLFNRSPRALLGTYGIAQAQGAIIAGAGVITAVKVGDPQLAVKVSVQFAEGLGFNLGLNRMVISLDRSRM